MTTQAEPIDPTDTSVCQTCGESDFYSCECNRTQWCKTRQWRADNGGPLHDHEARCYSDHT